MIIVVIFLIAALFQPIQISCMDKPIPPRDYIFIPNVQKYEPTEYTITLDKRATCIIITTKYNDDTTECLIIHFPFRKNNIRTLKSFHTILNTHKPRIDIMPSGAISDTSRKLIRSELTVFTSRPSPTNEKTKIATLKRNKQLFQDIQTMHTQYYVCERRAAHHRTHASNIRKPTAHMLINKNIKMRIEYNNYNTTTKPECSNEKPVALICASQESV